MKITKTTILDSNLISNDQTSKILLLDNLLEQLIPLFYEETRKKQGQYSNNVVEIKKLKNVISEYRKHLIELKSDLVAESLKNKIMLEIEILSKTNVKSPKIKNTILEIISSIDSLPIGEMEKRLALFQNINQERSRRGKLNEEAPKRSV